VTKSVESGTRPGPLLPLLSSWDSDQPSWAVGIGLGVGASGPTAQENDAEP